MRITREGNWERAGGREGQLELLLWELRYTGCYGDHYNFYGYHGFKPGKNVSNQDHITPPSQQDEFVLAPASDEESSDDDEDQTLKDVSCHRIINYSYHTEYSYLGYPNL